MQKEDLAKLHDLLADPDLYARDPARFAKESPKAVGDADGARLPRQWLALEMLKEEIEGERRFVFAEGETNEHPVGV